MLGSIISAASSLLGGQLDRENQEDINNANARLQREFAQNGIRWKVDDAKAAGIHPLFALGAQTIGASPSYVDGGSMGKAFSDAGQDIGRAIDAKRTSAERTTARLEALTVERGELENQLLRSQIAKLNQPGHPPALPGSTGAAPGVRIIPREVISNEGDTEVGKAAAHRRVDFSSGDTVRIAGDDMQQAIEEGPANWYYQLTRTIPDMVWADSKYLFKQAKEEVKRRNSATRRLFVTD
nr:MAG: DNA pilot protein [Microvirus sp.]